MVAPTTQTPRGAHAGRRARVGGGRLALRVVGEIVLTVGVVLLLFWVYEAWWTNVTAGRLEQQRRDDIVASWQETPAPRPTGGSPAPTRAEPAPGEGFAFLYVPRLRDLVWRAPVVQGVSPADLRGAVGHYPGTALPGQVGNVALAAHRATNGELFRDIDELRRGDLVVIETADRWFLYRLERDRIVSPDDVEVIAPVPERPGATPTQRVVTLTTCNPRWASYERWIWWGTQVDERLKSQGPPPGLGIGG